MCVGEMPVCVHKKQFTQEEMYCIWGGPAISFNLAPDPKQTNRYQMLNWLYVSPAHNAFVLENPKDYIDKCANNIHLILYDCPLSASNIKLLTTSLHECMKIQSFCCCKNILYFL